MLVPEMGSGGLTIVLVARSRVTTNDQKEKSLVADRDGDARREWDAMRAAKPGCARPIVIVEPLTLRRIFGRKDEGRKPFFRRF